VWATAWPISSARPSIGTALGHARLYVLSDDGVPVHGSSYGEAYIGGPAVARGYRNRPHLTCASFVPDPWSPTPGARMYATGDVVRIVDGELEFGHRRDTQVKVNGNRIELGEVESVAVRVDRVDAAAAVVVDAGSEPVLVLYVASTANPQTVADAVRAQLRRMLPAVMVPRTVTVLDALPVTTNGKVDRGRLVRDHSGGPRPADAGHDVREMPAEPCGG
jgi:acyl-coenzyme A synthetase/AMP-(fatty) acid ligase